MVTAAIDDKENATDNSKRDNFFIGIVILI